MGLKKKLKKCRKLEERKQKLHVYGQIPQEAQNQKVEMIIKKTRKDHNPRFVKTKITRNMQKRFGKTNL